MTVYTGTPDTAIDQDSALTQPVMFALRDDPLAIAEGDASAPPMASAWLNYTGTGTAAQTLTAIYDFSVHGTVATITSPDFADGWEYLFWFDEVTTSGGATDDLRIEAYRATSAAYAGASTILTDATNSIVRGYLAVHAPRSVRNFHRLEAGVTDGTAANSNTLVPASTETSVGLIVHATAQKLLNIRFSWTVGSFNGGKIYMMKRQARV